ncbi:uncharacterized protein A4U43_C10F2690 [Asparagus officinalis]|uniref:Uncharacterized protein n=1 Tax=Asparagus officinalis TaxID=4686 RepID=A0A5P1E0F2_ASPOF|nr:uncharacterized protein A4U43_C10F2690 [Asparagus officinalis]
MYWILRRAPAGVDRAADAVLGELVRGRDEDLAGGGEVRVSVRVRVWGRTEAVKLLTNERQNNAQRHYHLCIGCSINGFVQGPATIGNCDYDLPSNSEISAICQPELAR